MATSLPVVAKTVEANEELTEHRPRSVPYCTSVLIVVMLAALVPFRLFMVTSPTETKTTRLANVLLFQPSNLLAEETLVTDETETSSLMQASSTDKPTTHTKSSTELGRNLKNESITYSLATATNPNTLELNLTTGPNRAPCYYNASCVYRLYLDGPAKLGTYLHHYENATYTASLPLHEPGKYRVLVLLETLRNTSEITDGNFWADAVCAQQDEYICMGQRVSRSDAVIDVPMSLPRYQTKATLYRQTLPVCHYRASDLETNHFEWVSRKRLQQSYGFSPQTSGIIPPESMPPGGENAPQTPTTTNMFIANDSRPEWIQPNQDYVWHSRTCRQPWVTPHAIRKLASSTGLVVGFVGTSRLRQTSELMQRFLRDSISIVGLVKLLYGPTIVYNNSPQSMTERLTQLFQDELRGLCPPEWANLKYTPKVAIVISHGIWEASYHGAKWRDKGKFRFDDNARTTIEFVQKQCAGRDYRIILMTNPATQVFDGRLEDPFQADQGVPLTGQPYTSGENLALRNARINVANMAWKRAAHHYIVSIVDGEAMSFPRFEMSMDNVHYRLRYTNVELGNEVTMTFVQHILAAMLQAFAE